MKLDTNLYEVVFILLMQQLVSVQQASDIISCIPDEAKGVLNEVWTSIGSPGDLRQLVTDSRFPDKPTGIRVLPTFNVPRDAGNRYGQRMRAYMVVPFSGSYQFTVSCNWQCEVYLSSDYNPDGRKMILETDLNHIKYSVTHLTKNTPYYLEALHSDGVGNDYLELMVKFPGSHVFKFIPEDFLMAYVPGNQTGTGNHSLPGNWASWSPCSKSCGIGHVIRHRSCAARPPVVFIKSKLNSTDLALNKTGTCGHRVSCTGIKYFLTQSWQSCDHVCAKNGYTCAKTGHDFPPKSALPIYKALNLTCMQNSENVTKYRYADHPAFYPVPVNSSVGQCIGYEDIPDDINCAKHANPGAIRICPCKPLLRFLGPPGNISAYNTSSTSIKVTWSAVSSPAVIGYQVTLNDTITKDSRSMDCNTSTTYVMFLGLDKYKTYCASVLVVTSNGKGNSSECLNVTTEEDVPDRPPDNFQASANSSWSISVSWDRVPEGHRHGTVIGYVLFYFSLNATGAERKQYNLTLPSTSRAVELSGLKPSTLYCIKILASTRIGNGAISNCVTVRTPKQAAVEGYFNVIASSFISPFFIKVQWTSQVKVLKGLGLVGYKLIYTQSIIDGNEDDLRRTATILIHDKYTDNYTIDGLKPFSKVAVQVVAMGTDGPLKYSTTVMSETCRCPIRFVSIWWNKPPYTINATVDHSTPDGLLPRTLSTLVKSVCGTCATYARPEIVYKPLQPSNSSVSPEFNSTTNRLLYQSKQGDFSFPIHEPLYQNNKGSLVDYLPFIRVPGIVFVTKQKSPATYARTLVWSVFQCWPLVAINIVMAFMAGIITWILDSSDNRHHFPVPFVKGIQEAFWWAFVTMTTVGYGDRVPKSIPARIFAVIWSLMGIILSSLLTSALTSALIITVVTENYYTESGKRIATVADSMECRLVQQMTGKSGNAISFPNVDKLFRALEEGHVEAALVDIHTAFFYKKLFSKSKFKITKVIHHEFTYGVLVGGEASRLMNLFRQQIEIENTNVVEYLQELLGFQDNKYKGTEQFITQKAKIDFLDPSTELYYLVILLLVSLLAVGIACGLLYHVIQAKKRSRVKPGNLSVTDCYRSTTETVRTMLHQFHQDIQNTCEELKRRHKKELRSLISIKNSQIRD